MKTACEILEAFFVAENQRDWRRYVEFLHPDVEWMLNGRVIQGSDAYLEMITGVYADSDAVFRLHQILQADDDHFVATLLVNHNGKRSLDIFEFEDGLIRREWEYLMGPGPDWNGDSVEF